MDDISPKTIDEVKNFTFEMRSLLGGDLHAILVHRPKLFESTENCDLLNIIVLVTELSQAYAERVFKQHFLEDNTDFRYSVEIVGIRSFKGKLDIGDPAVIELCLSSNVIYEAEDAFEYLLKLASNDERSINKKRLLAYLLTKSFTHFRNVRYQLAKTLNELYLAILSGIARQRVSQSEALQSKDLHGLCNWEEVRKHLPDLALDDIEIGDVETILVDIKTLLMGADFSALRYGKAIMSSSDELMELLNILEDVKEAADGAAREES